MNRLIERSIKLGKHNTTVARMPETPNRNANVNCFGNCVAVLEQYDLGVITFGSCFTVDDNMKKEGYKMEWDSLFNWHCWITTINGMIIETVNIKEIVDTPELEFNCPYNFNPGYKVATLRSEQDVYNTHKGDGISLAYVPGFTNPINGSTPNIVQQMTLTKIAKMNGMTIPLDEASLMLGGASLATATAESPALCG